MRSGDEPSHARSPLRLRLVLAVAGAVFALTGTAVFRSLRHDGWTAAFVVVGLVALVDLVAVGHRIRQGPHYQPGRTTPPYRPAEIRERGALPTDPPTGGTQVRAREPDPVFAPGLPVPPSRHRVHRYLALMAGCLVLFVVAGVWVRPVSTAVATWLALAAAVIPVVAVVLSEIDRRRGQRRDRR